MTIAAFIAGLAVVVLIACKALQNGFLLNQGKKFITHNVSFSKLSSGQLRLKARGGLLTDRFNITLPPSDIDLFAFAVGHRPKNKRLDKEGYGGSEDEKASLKYRRSIYISNDIKAGEPLTPENIRIVRPGFGISPKYYDLLIGRRVNKDLIKGTAMSWEYIG